MACGDKKGGKAPWQKVLYLDQPYEDNHVDDSFLDSLVLNAHFQPYDYLVLCRGAMAIVQQVCVVCVFVGVWSRMQSGVWKLDILFALDVTLLVIGYGLTIIRGRWRGLQGVLSDAWRGVRTVGPLWVVSPLLQTLTRSWSDDTIAALSLCLLVVHVFLYDYGRASPAAHSLPSGAVALNAAMLAATILASRLETSDQVFAFALLAMELFAFLPWLSAWLQLRSAWAHSCLLTPLGFVSAAALLGTVPAAMALFGVLFCIGFVGPALLVSAQRYKKEIQGPWDIAHVEPGATCVEAVASDAAPKMVGEKSPKSRGGARRRVDGRLPVKKTP